MMALFVTLVSLIPSDQWFIRAVDMVRVLSVFVAAALFVLALLVAYRLRSLTLIALALVMAINIWRVWPYWRIAPTDIPLAQVDGGGDTASERCFSALSLNVKMANTGYKAVAGQLRRYDPDLILLMETDADWVEALEPILAEYSTVERYPKSNTYGLIFASRIPVTNINVIENTSRDTPTLYATLTPAGSAPVEFIGLHPRPPLPGQNTKKRDENILNAGVQTPDRLPNALVMGDFNDVPWSNTSDLFRKQGGWNDPRIGRGNFPTFPADYLPIGWPLDQVMVKGAMTIQSFDVLDDVGSDHLAMLANVCAPAAAT